MKKRETIRVDPPMIWIGQCIVSLGGKIYFNFQHNNFLGIPTTSKSNGADMHWRFDEKKRTDRTRG